MWVFELGDAGGSRRSRLHIRGVSSEHCKFLRLVMKNAWKDFKKRQLLAKTPDVQLRRTIPDLNDKSQAIDLESINSHVLLGKPKFESFAFMKERHGGIKLTVHWQEWNQIQSALQSLLSQKIRMYI